VALIIGVGKYLLAKKTKFWYKALPDFNISEITMFHFLKAKKAVACITEGRIRTYVFLMLLC
jgi:hypothetical protein